MVSFLATSGQGMAFDAFCAALDYQRQQAVTPTAHLFTQRTSRAKEQAQLFRALSTHGFEMFSAFLSRNRGNQGPWSSFKAIKRLAHA